MCKAYYMSVMNVPSVGSGASRGRRVPVGGRRTYGDSLPAQRDRGSLRPGLRRTLLFICTT